MRQNALALLGLERQEDALRVARTFVHQNPRSAKAHVLLANLHLRAGRTTEALGTLSFAPLTRDVALQQAALLAQSGERDVAESLLTGVIERDPRDIDAWKPLGRLLIDADRALELEGLLTAALKHRRVTSSVPVTVELVLLRAEAHEAAERYDLALADYQEALRIAPKHVKGLNNAAWLISRRFPELRGKAVEYSQLAVALAPDHPQVNHTAGMVQHAAGEPLDAIKYVERALEKIAVGTPKESEYRLDLADVYIAADKSAEARAILIDVVRRFPNTPQARRAAESIRALEGR